MIEREQLDKRRNKEWLGWILVLPGLCIAGVLFFKGENWFSRYGLPFLETVVSLLSVVVFPLSIVLVIFNATRLLGARLMYLLVYLQATYAFFSFLVFLSLNGAFLWMLIGLLIGPLGLVSAAVVFAINRSEWSSGAHILLFGGAALAIRWLAGCVERKAQVIAQTLSQVS